MIDNTSLKGIIQMLTRLSDITLNNLIVIVVFKLKMPSLLLDKFGLLNN